MWIWILIWIWPRKRVFAAGCGVVAQIVLGGVAREVWVVIVAAMVKETMVVVDYRW